MSSKKSKSASSSKRSLPNPPSLVDSPTATFLVFEAPNDANLPLYIDEMNRNGCRNIVRACDASYSEEPLLAAGIAVHEISFPDGSAPPDAVVDRWIKLVTQVQKDFKGKGKPCIAVHCVAGLGRAPVLVAVAMVENGVDPLAAIKEIRAKRPGALNMPQLKYLQAYKRRGKPCIIV
eukprot:TRINITY_DN1395_c0_g1_i1.p1 TRINITY_DN1395_c0_g1~~TRINITY_DN1395_c0_g1_i1.p1  ORF type:complete len:177 (-),score=72.66 TRINITY_DN1395_c0_g1_i1:67-597(-)